MEFTGAAIGIARNPIERLYYEEEAERNKLQSYQIRERERSVTLPFILIRRRVLQPDHQGNDMMSGEEK